MQRRPQGRRVRKINLYILQATHRLSNQAVERKCENGGADAGCRKPIYPSFAVIVIFAFRTFDTGHPFSAASAYF